MKSTGIVRRIDDLGRVVIPKEIRRTLRIREGDPLEIFTTREGEVIFKKYSIMGSMEDSAAVFCEGLNRCTEATAAVTDRDIVIAAAGPMRKNLSGQALSAELSRITEQRNLWLQDASRPAVPVCDGQSDLFAVVVAPILCQGDVLGAVIVLNDGPQTAGETECKLAQMAASFLGKSMEA